PSRAHVAWLPDALAGWLFLRCSGLLRDLHFPYTTLFRSDGEAVAYALFNLEDRGPLMIGPQTRVYQGMIVGEHSRENDLEVNVLDRKSTRLNSSHVKSSYAVFCLKKKSECHMQKCDSLTP